MYNLGQFNAVTGALSKAGLTNGTNAGTLRINAPNGAGVDFAINGYAYHKADTDNIAFTAAAQQAAQTTCLYGIWLDASGNVVTTKGREVSNAALANGDVVLQNPPEPTALAGNCALIGFLRIVTANAATFTAGTTSLTATDVTATWFDLASFPARPRTA